MLRDFNHTPKRGLTFCMYTIERKHKEKREYIFILKIASGLGLFQSEIQRSGACVVGGQRQ